MRPLVLGILNVTPDSFSDGGQHNSRGAALDRAREMLDEGADIIDVGGESTRPGAAEVTIDEETARVVPIISALSSTCRVSIDTRKPEVARAAVEAGATIINDVSASLWRVAADTGAGWIAMHMQGEPGSMQSRPVYADVVGEVRDFLVERANLAKAAGVADVWIDPGFGFGKTLDHNMALLANLDQFVRTGVPVAVGLSRKSMFGTLLGRSDGNDEPALADDRVEGSVGAATFAMMLGASMIRVHDVKATAQAVSVVSGGDEFAAGRNDGYRLQVSTHHTSVASSVPEC